MVSRKDYMKRWRKQNRQRLIAYNRRWRKANREHVRASQRRWEHKQPNYSRTKWVRQRYGLTLSQRDKLFLRFAGKCYLCRTLLAVVIDHDHATGRVRGALCHACNHGLSCFKDSPKILERAAGYVCQPTKRKKQTNKKRK